MNRAQRIAQLIELASGEWVGFDTWLGLRADDSTVRVDNGRGIEQRAWSIPSPTELPPATPGALTGRAPWER